MPPLSRNLRDLLRGLSRILATPCDFNRFLPKTVPAWYITSAGSVCAATVRTAMHEHENMPTSQRHCRCQQGRPSGSCGVCVDLRGDTVPYPIRSKNDKLVTAVEFVRGYLWLSDHLPDGS